MPLERFNTVQSKEDLARPYQDTAVAADRSGLVLVGKAQGICARLGAGHVRDLLGRMKAVVPDRSASTTAGAARLVHSPAGSHKLREPSRSPATH